MIKLQVIGNLGKDGLTNLVNGKNVINFSVAHSEKYTDGAGALQERTTWVDCAYWTEKLGIVPYLKKGQQVYVEGAPEVRQFQKSDGSHGASLTLRVLNLQLVGGAPQQQTVVAPPAQHSTAPTSTGEAATPADGPEKVGGSDDLPF